MSNLESLFDNAEHEYRVAGWLGSISVMAAIGSSDQDPRHLTGLNKSFYETCLMIAKEEENMLDVIEVWHTNRDEHRDAASALNHAGILDHRALPTSDFKDAYDIHNNPSWRHYVESQTTFGRLCEAIYDTSSYYSERVDSAIAGTSLAFFIRDTRRDISFYVGLYDPIRL